MRDDSLLTRIADEGTNAARLFDGRMLWHRVTTLMIVLFDDVSQR